MLRRLSIRALALVPWAALAFLVVILGGWVQGGDGDVYYGVAFPPDYSASSIATATFNYSPAFALLVQPFKALGEQGFTTLILALEVIALGYLVGPWVALLLIGVEAPLVYRELLEANLNLSAAALVVVGLRSPWPWAALLLTKVTPGVGLVWFAARREWRPFVIALACTVAVVVVVAVLTPSAWPEWIGALLDNSGRMGTLIPPPLRILLGAGVVAYAARTDRRWLVPLAVAVAYPVPFLGWVAVLGMWRLAFRPDPPEGGMRGHGVGVAVDE